MNKDYELLLAITKKSLVALDRILDKAAAHVAEKGIEESVILSASLAPDMMDFTRQIQISSDYARKNLARLSGKDPISMEDTETTIAQLKERVVKTLDVVNSFTSSDFTEADTREIRLPWFQGTYMLGKDFLYEFAITNFQFHVVTAYDILRAQGGAIGKADFIGEMSMYPITSPTV